MSGSPIPLVDLCEEESVPKKRKKSPVKQESVSLQEYTELNKRISRLEGFVQQSENKKSSTHTDAITREEFNRSLERIGRLEERVANIEQVFDRFRNVLESNNAISEKPQSQHTQSNSNSRQDKSNQNGPILCSDRVLLSTSSMREAHASSTPVKAISCANDSNELTPPPMVSTYGQRPLEDSLNRTENTAMMDDEDEETDRELEIDLGRIPVKQELFERQHSQSTAIIGEFLRTDAEGNIVIFICGMARKLRNKERYAAVYCWSVSDKNVSREHYFSALNTKHITIEAEILAGLFALRCLKENNLCSAESKIIVVARSNKLVDTMNKIVYPNKDTCRCLEVPCADNPLRWVTNDALARNYHEDLPKLILAQEGMHVNWVVFNGCNLGAKHPFIEYAKQSLSLSLRK